MTNGAAYIAIGAGALLTYAGIRGYSVVSAAENIIQGKNPNTGQKAASLTNSTTNTNSNSSTIQTDANLTSYPTNASIAALWVACGGPADTANFASQVAMAESSGSATVTSSNPDGGTNVGLFQLDTLGVGSGYTVAQLQNPVTNTRITIKATNGGRDWQEWADPVVDAVGGVYNP